MEFGTYKPNFIPRPVEQIATMLGKLDENNRRIATSYNNIAQTFDSFDVNPVDREYVDNVRSDIMSSIDQVIESGDYARMEGQLNKSIRRISSDQGLKARILRNQDYNTKRNMVKDMYYKNKDIDKLSYDIAMSQPFMPTQPDEHGVYNNEYNEFILPPRYFDIQNFAMQVAKNVEANSTTESPTIKYMTKKDYLLGLGEDISKYSEEELKQPTKHIAFLKLGDKTYKTPKQVNDAIVGMLQANPDAQAYLNYISEHTNKPVSNIVAEYVNPIVNMSSYINDNSRYQVLSGYSANKEKDEEAPGNMPSISTEVPLDVKDEIIDKVSPSWLRENARKASVSVGEMLKGSSSKLISDVGEWMSGSIDKSPIVQPDDPHYGIYETVSKKYYSKPYSELNDEERVKLLEPLTEYVDNLYKEGLANIVTVKSKDAKVNEKVMNRIASSNQLSIDKSGEIENAFENGTYFNFDTGEALTKDQFYDYLKDNISKNTKKDIYYNGYSPFTGLGSYYDNNMALNRMHRFSIGEHQFGFSPLISERNEYELFVDDIYNTMHAIKNNSELSKVIKNKAFSTYVDYDHKEQIYKLENVGGINLNKEYTGDNPDKLLSEYLMDLYKATSN